MARPKAVTLADGIGFPHDLQAIQITRKRRRPNSKKWTVETVCAITDLAPEHAAPHQLRTWLRGQRASRQACNGSATSPTAKATLGRELETPPKSWSASANLAINLNQRLSGATNIAAALRHHARTTTNPNKLVLTS